MFPSYGYSIVQEKKRCYPPDEFIHVSESEAVVELEALLNHTFTRLMEFLKPKIMGNVTVYFKWGMDGSSGHSQFKQAFEDKTLSDVSVFITTIVPVLLEDEGKRVIWENPTPNSTK